MDDNDGSIHVNLFGIICSTLCSVGALSGQLQSVPGFLCFNYDVTIKQELGQNKTSATG